MAIFTTVRVTGSSKAVNELLYLIDIKGFTFRLRTPQLPLASRSRAHFDAHFGQIE
jgi:hypothetical protein